MNLEKKKPTELTNEELYVLVQQMTKIMVQRKQQVNIIAESEDITQDVLTYLYDKSSRGKVGIEEIKENTMSHFQNIIWREISNCINYKLRKPKVQRFLNNTVSLQEPAKYTDIHAEKDQTYEDIIEGYNPIEELEEDLYVKSVLEKFSDTIKDNNLEIILDIGDKKCSLTFSYRNIARVYLNLFEGKKLTSKDFEKVFFDKNTKHTLEDKSVKNILTDFRKYIKQNNILGGDLV